MTPEFRCDDLDDLQDCQDELITFFEKRDRTMRPHQNLTPADHAFGAFCERRAKRLDIEALVRSMMTWLGPSPTMAQLEVATTILRAELERLGATTGDVGLALSTGRGAPQTGVKFSRDVKTAPELVSRQRAAHRAYQITAPLSELIGGGR